MTYHCRAIYYNVESDIYFHVYREGSVILMSTTAAYIALPVSQIFFFNVFFGSELLCISYTLMHQFK